MLEQYKTEEEFKNKFNVSDELFSQFYTYAEGAGLKANPAKAKKAEGKLKLYLKAFLAKQIWRMDGFYYITNGDDEVVKMAVKELTAKSL